MTSLNFKKGVAIIRKGRKIVAKVVDRLAKAKVFENETGKKWPYGIGEIVFHVYISGGCFECKNMDEVQNILTRYSN